MGAACYQKISWQRISSLSPSLSDIDMFSLMAGEYFLLRIASNLLFYAKEIFLLSSTEIMIGSLRALEQQLSYENSTREFHSRAV